MRIRTIGALPVCVAIGFAHVTVAATSKEGVVSDGERVDETQSASSAETEQLRESRRTRSIEELIVTAQRREERLQDVPISITALRGEELDSSTLIGLNETLKRIPGVSTNFGSIGNPRVMIRGVPWNDAAGSTVGYYVDSLPFGQARLSFSPVMNLYDLDRVEVLRGPQGTLYGANSMAGVVRLLTKAPDLNRFEAKTRASFATIEDGGEGYRADAAVNLPLIEDRLALRLVGGYEDRGGWIDAPNRDDRNDGDVKTLRAKLRAQPSEALTLDATAWFSRTHVNAQDLGAEDRTTTAPIDEPHHTDFDTYSLAATYDFGGVSLTSSTSYIDFALDPGVFSWHSFSPDPFFFNTSTILSEVFSEELALQSTGEGPWRWSIGAMYRDAKDRWRNVRSDGGITFDYSDHSKSTAVFGEVTRELLDGKVDATVGLRYFEDDFFTGENFLPTGAVRPLARAEETSDAVTPRVVLAWHPTDDSSVYASYAQGFRGGLPQSPITLSDPRATGSSLPGVKPDKLSNYEIGAKGTLFDGRVSLETAVFYMNWQDIKTVLPFVTPFGFTLTTVQNGESASGMGVDMAISFRPIDRLEIGGNVSWNDLTSDTDVFSAGGTLLFAKGGRMGTPETTANGFVEYSFPLGSLTGHLSGAINYLDRSDKDPDNTVEVYKSDYLTTTSARFTIESGNRWSASLFGDNLTDENGNAGSGLFEVALARIPPRTIGLQVEYRWD